MRRGHLATPSTSIAIEHMVLQAVDEGPGTCWVGAFHEDQVKAVLGIPGKVRVVESLTLGYPADKQRTPAPGFRADSQLRRWNF